jgi:molecular chaperone HtpG
VASAQGSDRELARLLARQYGSSGARPILELNMEHEPARLLATARKAGRDQNVGDLASLLLDQAHILDGEIPSDPAAFTKRLNNFVVRGLKADS